MSDQFTSRRRFLKTLTAGAGAAAVGSFSARSYARILGSNERVGFGVIGIGQQGRGHLFSFTKVLRNEVDVLGLADVYQPNLDYALTLAPGVPAHKDFRTVLDNKEIDAVLIASPDHWHCIQTIQAIDAGKDVYVEKPCETRIGEGRKMVEAARRNNKIVQVGTQQRSGKHFQDAVEFIRSGKLGNVSFVRSWNYGNEGLEGIGNPPDSAPVAGLDWDMWLGPAPERPFNINRFGVTLDEQKRYTRWATFRYFWDYAGGMMTDWGVHLLDIVQWAMGVDYPKEVSAMGGKFYVKDNRDTPDTLSVTYTYPGFVSVYENKALNGFPMEGHSYGSIFYGTAGTLFIDRSGYEVTPEKGSGLEPLTVKASDDQLRNHHRDFLESIKTRKPPICDIEIGHRSSATAILGTISYRTGRKLVWDGEKERVVGDDEANKLLLPQSRKSWAV